MTVQDAASDCFHVTLTAARPDLGMHPRASCWVNRFTHNMVTYDSR